MGRRRYTLGGMPDAYETQLKPIVNRILHGDCRIASLQPANLQSILQAYESGG